MSIRTSDGDAVRATFVDDEVRITEGEAAEAMVREKNERAWFEANRGIAQVSTERWEEAQRYERTTWLNRGRRTVDDRNLRHRQRFADYEFLKDQRFERAIELGCGPFTNMRYILELADIESVELLDPLASHYLQHPFCRYRGGRLGGVLHSNAEQALGLRHPMQLLEEKRNRFRIGGLWGKPVVVHSMSIEQFSPVHSYDLVVIVNVLEHCQDAALVLERIASMLKPGGTLVYADKIYRAAKVELGLERHYDAGHPLRVDQSVIDAFLDGSFSPKMRAIYARRPRILGDADSELYFIGTRL